MTIHVVVVDDQALILAGLLAMPAAAPGFEPVGEAENGSEALDVVAATRPDVVLIDIRMPVMDRIEAARRILTPPATGAEPDSEPPKVFVLTTFDLDEYVYTALRVGAAGSCSRTPHPTGSWQPSRRSLPVTSSPRRASPNGWWSPTPAGAQWDRARVRRSTS